MNDSNVHKAETLAHMYQQFTKEFPEVGGMVLECFSSVHSTLDSPCTTVLQVEGIMAKDLHNLLGGPDAGNLVLVDVRTPDEQEVSRLPGPLLFTREDFERIKADYRDRDLVTYW